MKPKMIFIKQTQIMKQESKDLLLKDLCGRLPYGVKCQVREGEYTYIGTLCRIEVDNKNGYLLDFAESISGLDCQVNLSEIKPYLFPLSSLTAKQKKELWNEGWSIRYWDLCNDRYNGHGFEFVSHSDCRDLIDWLNKNHFDYRDLLSKGLAIDATNLNIY